MGFHIPKRKHHLSGVALLRGRVSDTSVRLVPRRVKPPGIKDAAHKNGSVITRKPWSELTDEEIAAIAAKRGDGAQG